MRLAVFTESLPPLNDGVARTFTRLAESLNQEGVDFRFFAPVAPPGAELQAEPWRGRVRRLPSLAIPLYAYYRIGLPYFQSLDQELNKFAPHILHATTPTPLGFWAVDYARRRRLPIVSSYHTHFVSYFPYYRLGKFQQLGWSLLRAFHNRCLASYAPSPSACHELNEQGIRGARLWQRGIDLQAFSGRHLDIRLRRQLSQGGRKVLLFVGRLVKEKNLEEFIGACHLLKAWGYATTPVLVGEGPFKVQLRASLPEAVLPGFKQGRELAAYYACADIFAFPSCTETFGNVVLEAMATGLPVVGARQGGVADVVLEGKTGLLARPQDEMDFAVKLETLLTHPGLARRLGRNGAREARRYHWSRINHGLIEDYRQCAREFQISQLPEKQRKRRARRIYMNSFVRI